MKKYKTFVLVAALLTTGSLWAKNVVLQPEGLLTLEISEFAPNRLVFTSGKIAEVFFYPEESAKVILHKSGTVFVVPLEGKRHVYLTLIGEEGVTQDLRLNFVKKPPEPIRFLAKTKAAKEQTDFQQPKRSK